MKIRKAQSSMEYIAIMGLVILVLTILVGIAGYYSRSASDTITISQVDKIAKEIVDTAEIVYYGGTPSKQTIKVYIPENIEEISISDKDINFKVRSGSGLTDIGYSSKVDLAGAISNSPGYRNILIEAREDLVWIDGTV